MLHGHIIGQMQRLHNFTTFNVTRFAGMGQSLITYRKEYLLSTKSDSVPRFQAPLAEGPHVDNDRFSVADGVCDEVDRRGHFAQQRGPPRACGLWVRRIDGPDFTNGEEEDVGLTKVVAFLVEDELMSLGPPFPRSRTGAFTRSPTASRSPVKIRPRQVPRPKFHQDAEQIDQY